MTGAGKPWWLAGVALVAAVGWKIDAIRPIVNPAVRQEDLDVHESNATASLMGQFRTSVSSWLWLRTDLYLHNGVEMRPVSEEEQKRGVTIEDAKDDGHEKLRAEKEITVVPPKERDFRGIFGDVERQVASFKDMHGHTHNDPSQAMPLFRLMTWLDPQFVQGWTTGAMVLARDRTPVGTTLSTDFLKEGWKNNPHSVDIPSQIGYTIASRHGDLATSVAYLEAARKIGIERRQSLSEPEVEALNTTYRWLALCYRDLNDVEQEKAILEEGLTAFPDDKVMPHMLQKARQTVPGSR